MAMSPLDPRRPWADIPLHVVDFEGSRRTGVVEYGVATLLGGRLVGLRTALCAPSSPVPGAETRCHGLTDRDLEGRRPFSAEWPLFNELRGSGLLASHQASVEASLLAATWPHPAAVPAVSETEVAEAQWGPWVDSLALARARLPGLPGHSLGEVVAALGLAGELAAAADALCPEGRRRPHCAGFDALAAALAVLRLAPPRGRIADLLAMGSPGGSDAAQGELPL